MYIKYKINTIKLTKHLFDLIVFFDYAKDNYINLLPYYIYIYIGLTIKYPPVKLNSFNVPIISK